MTRQLFLFLSPCTINGPLDFDKCILNMPAKTFTCTSTTSVIDFSAGIYSNRCCMQLLLDSMEPDDSNSREHISLVILYLERREREKKQQAFVTQACNVNTFAWKLNKMHCTVRTHTYLCMHICVNN